MTGGVFSLAQKQAVCLRKTRRSGAQQKFLRSGLKWKPAGETTFLPASRLPIKPQGPVDTKALTPYPDRQK